MKVALVGASGAVGSRLLAELVRRGHRVTALARQVDRIVALDGVERRAVDAADGPALAAVLRGHDAVISALRFSESDPAGLIGAVRQAGVERYLVVGGAGSLEVAPGIKLVDRPGVPDHVKVEANAGSAFLAALKREDALNWTFLSPSGMLVDGERTGRFRLGGDRLLVGADGRSWISYEDYAVALIDELEQPRHDRQRFTVGY